MYNFLIGIVSSSILYIYNPVLSVLYAFVSLIQLYDYLFWTHPTKSAFNFWLTKLAMITNHLQPIVLALAIVTVGKQALRPLSKAFLIAYTLVALVYSTIAWKKISYTQVSPLSYGSLYWEWNYAPGRILMYSLFIATVCLLIYEHIHTPMNILAALLVLFSFLLSYMLYKGRTVGRFWCWIGGWTPIVYVLFYLFFFRR